MLASAAGYAVSRAAAVRRFQPQGIETIHPRLNEGTSIRSTTRAKRRTAVAAAAVLPLLLSACSAGSLGSSSGGDSASTIKLLVDNAPDNLAAAKQLAKDFQAKNPKIRVSVETRPGGADGDNLIKTRLQTDSMAEVFS